MQWQGSASYIHVPQSKNLKCKNLNKWKDVRVIMNLSPNSMMKGWVWTATFSTILQSKLFHLIFDLWKIIVLLCMVGLIVNFPCPACRFSNPSHQTFCFSWEFFAAFLDLAGHYSRSPIGQMVFVTNRSRNGQNSFCLHTREDRRKRKK